jgi:hypothetical protein
MASHSGLRSPSSFDFDDCMRVCKAHETTLTDQERVALSIVAGAYACSQQVTDTELTNARRIVREHEAPTGLADGTHGG